MNDKETKNVEKLMTISSRSDDDEADRHILYIKDITNNNEIFSIEDGRTVISLPAVIAQLDNIGKNRVIIYLLHMIASIRDYNRKLDEDASKKGLTVDYSDYIDERNAFTDTINHFGSVEVAKFIYRYSMSPATLDLGRFIQLLSLNVNILRSQMPDTSFNQIDILTENDEQFGLDYQFSI